MIKFKRFPHRVGTAIPWSRRRESLAKSKPQREVNKLKKKLPLLAEVVEDIVDTSTVDPEAVRQQRQDNYDYNYRKRRQREAKTWLSARKRFRELDEEKQSLILYKWNNNRFRPQTAVYFWGLIDVISGDQAKRMVICNKQTQEIHDRVNKENKNMERRQPALF